MFRRKDASGARQILEYQKLALLATAPNNPKGAQEILAEIKYMMFPHLRVEADEKDKAQAELVEQETKYAYKFFRCEDGKMNAYKDLIDGD